MTEPLYNNCFACGVDNPIGLKLKFDYTEDEAVTYFTVTNSFQGYPGIVHGGIIATLLDEAMAKIIIKKDLVAVTAELNVKYRKTIPLNEELKISGCIIKEKSRVVQTTGKIELNGVVLAEASALYIKIRS